MCVCVCLFVYLGERKRKKFYWWLVSVESRVGTGFCQLGLDNNPAPRWPDPQVPVHHFVPVYFCVCHCEGLRYS